MTRIHWPAAERNQQPILEALRLRLPEGGLFVEIGSGTGQHTRCFAEALPGLCFQPSDCTDERFDSIEAWCEGLENTRAPLLLDAAAERWPIEHADVVFSANVVHISPVAVLHGLVAGAGRILGGGGLLALYGPFLINGKATTPSNEAFDRSLKSRDPRWGLRDLSDVTERAEAAGLLREDVLTMPANNFLVLFRRAP